MTRTAFVFCVSLCMIACGGGGGGSPASPTASTPPGAAGCAAANALQVYSASQPGGPWTGPQSVTIAGSGAQLCADPSPLLAPDGSILLYYTMFTALNTSPSIGVAQSTDGRTFTHRAAVYTAGADGFSNVTDPSPLVLPDGRVRVFFSPAAGETFSTTSTDMLGVQFAGSLDAGQRAGPGTGCCPSELLIGSRYFLWLSSSATNYWTSTDALNFSLGGPISGIGGGTVSVINAGGGQYFMAYQCAGGTNPSMAVTCLASSSDGINWGETSVVGSGAVPGLVKTAGGQLLVYVVPNASTALGAVTLTLSPASGTQLTPFTITGSNYTPNGTVFRSVQFPGQPFMSISSIAATSTGTISFPFTPGCTHPTGATFFYVIDSSTGRVSPTIVEQINGDPSCAAGSATTAVSPSPPRRR